MRLGWALFGFGWALCVFVCLISRHYHKCFSSVCSQHPLAGIAPPPPLVQTREWIALSDAAWPADFPFLPQPGLPRTPNLIHSLHNNIYYHLSAWICRRPQLATDSRNLPQEEFHLIFMSFWGSSSSSTPFFVCLAAASSSSSSSGCVVATVSFVVRPRHTMFSEGDYKYLCLDWRQQARWHSQHTLSFFPSTTLPLRLPFSFPLLFGAIWSICLATSVEMNNKYRKYFGKRNSIRRTDADLITGHVLV